MFQKKIFALCLTAALCLHLTQSVGFESLNLSQDLVNRANAAVSNAKAQLSRYNCDFLEGKIGLISTLFDAIGYNGYQLYNTLNTVVTVLQEIKNTLQANNVIVGNGNLVNGTNNFVLGNYDIVNGNNDWIIASGVEIGKQFQSNNILVIGFYEIKLDVLGWLQYGPSKVIRCLNNTQKLTYFNLFGLQKNNNSPQNLPIFNIPLLKILF